MKILTSDLSMDASTGHTDVTRLSLSTGQLRQAGETGESPFKLNLPRAGSALASTFSYQASLSQVQSTAVVRGGEKEIHHVSSEKDVVETLISHITGRTTRVGDGGVEQPANSSSQDGTSRVARRYYRVGGRPFQMSFGVNVTRIEQQQMNISTTGRVATEDGREIDFGLNFSMEDINVSRSRVGLSGTNGILLDPIVLNFSGGVQSLSEKSWFTFDLDCDGHGDEICGLNRNSGFLALDLDSNGAIDDGRELFGPTSGSGYQELARYDDDGNNWIDENDAIFEKLQVWMNAGGAESSLISLKDAGVGAIALQHLDGSSFTLKAGDGSVLGQVAASGLFLTEDGQARPIQEIDLLAKADDENGSAPVGVGSESEAEWGDNLLLQTLRERLMAHREKMLALLEERRKLAREEAERQSWLEKKFWEWQDDQSIKIG